MARLLPVFAVLVFAAGLGLTIAVAGDTLGYDFHAYHAAVLRLLAGQPPYDLNYDIAGPYGLFLYPPTFIPLVLPWGLLPADVATWTWTAGLIATFATGVAVLPVRRSVQWWTVLLAGLSWPFVYAVKLGQVGPLLFLLFAVGWRWMGRGPVLGATGALGAAIKIQPGLILAWALLTRRWTAVLWGALVLVALAVLATLVAGIGAWGDFLVLIGRVSDPITTPHNFTPGAVAYQMGVPRDTAALIQWTSMAAAATVVVVTALRMGAVPSYLVAVIASQLLSPILWDHYALLLLLPVAWMLDRGHWWAAVFVLVTPVLAVGQLPPWVYPVAFWACLVAVVVTGLPRSRVASGSAAPGVVGP
jgi:hypothetical protein